MPGHHDAGAAAERRAQRRRVAVGRRGPRSPSCRSARASPGRRDRAPARTRRRASPPAPPSRRRSRSASARASPSACRPTAISTPPLDGGGFERNSWPRYSTVTGRRRITRYAGQILQRERAAARLHMRDDRPREIARIETLTHPRSASRSSVAPSSGNASRSPSRDGSPLHRVHRIALRRMPQQRIEDPRAGTPAPPSHEPLARERHRRRHELRPGHPPPAPMGRLEPQRRPRNRHRRRPVRNSCCVSPSKSTASSSKSAVATLLGTVTKKSSIDVLALRCRMNEHEATAARARQRAFADPGHEGRRNAGVHGRPAGLQHPRARLRGQRMPGCDRSFHAAFTF